LTVGSFIYGFIASGVYGWIVAIYNLWPRVLAAFAQRAVVR
jgi:dihydrodipicolinate synthase/N-acetylneuraminate lyase